MTDSFKRFSINRNNSKSNTSKEIISDDLKNDLQLAFNLYKNDENKINKLKLRTILFSFAMYKSSPKQINDYISEFFPKEDEFTFEQVCRLIYYKLKNIKEIESESLFSIINGGKIQSSFSKADLNKAFETTGIEISDREINEMMAFMNGRERIPEDEIYITKDEFKKFLN